MSTAAVMGRWLALALLFPLLAIGADREVETSFLATLKTGSDTPFADILGAGAQSRFTAVSTPGVSLSLVPNETVWLRLRAQLPQRADGEWVIRAPRTPVSRVELYVPEQPEAPIASTGFFELADPDTMAQPRVDHTGLRLALPAGPAGPAEFYLRLGGDVRTALVPELMTRAHGDTIDASAISLIRFSVIALALITVLGIVRFALQPHCGSGAVAFATAMLIPAVLAGTGVLYALPLGQGFANQGTMGLWMLLLLPCGPLLLATARYSGAPYALPTLMAKIRIISLALPFFAIAMLIVRTDLASELQIVVWLLWAALAIACLAMLLADSRRYRWGPIVAWTLVIFALWLRTSVELQWLDANRLTMLGSLPALVLLGATMLLLPWLRALGRQVGERRRETATPTLVGHGDPVAARAQLRAALLAAAPDASSPDADWIAFRRLLTGLKTLLPQTSSAIVATHHRGSDLLLVDPPDAEERYRGMLERSSSMLQGLSRSRGAQQLAIDFDGPTGPLPIVQLAIIPLPIEAPGWGLLLIERPSGVSYRPDELATASELAALAVQRSEPTVNRRREQRTREIDPGTGAYRTNLVEDLLQQQIAQAQLRGRPLAVLRVEFDGVVAWLESKPDAARAALAQIGDALREQLEFGETIARLSDSGFLLILPGRNADVCHPLAHRLLGAMQRLGLPPDVQPHVGITELRRGETRPGALLERSGQAAETARRSGTPTVA